MKCDSRGVYNAISAKKALPVRLLALCPEIKDNIAKNEFKEIG